MTSRSQIDTDFVTLALQLSLLEEADAATLAERIAQTGTPPGQLSQQLGLLDASQVDIVETLLQPQAAIPGYEILSLVGRGGMGVVYRARQLNLDREVALKTILVGRMVDRSIADRFEREAQLVGRLRHPHIVAAYDFGRHEGRLFLAMEFIDGKDGEEFVKGRGRLDEQTVWSIARQTASGLAHAAAQGVVHRDIKPANLLLVDAPEGYALPPGVPMVKIADFGLAFLSREAEVKTRLTSQTSTVGSPHYMAPEQLSGGDVDHRADIYALGASVYHLLAGRPPCAGSNLSQIVAAKLSGAVRPLSESAPRTSSASRVLVERMMARDPNDRFETYSELLAAIDSLESVATSTEKMPAVGVPVSGTVEDGLPGRPDDVAATQTMPMAGDQTYSFETSLPSGGPPWWQRQSFVVSLLIVVLVSFLGFYFVLSRLMEELPPRRMPMTSTGWSTPLFYGTSTTGWQNLSGNWVASRDDEGGNVLAGTDGVAARPLFLRQDEQGQMVPPTSYRLQLMVQPHKATEVAVHCRLAPRSDRDGPRTVIRLSPDGMALGEKSADSAAFEPAGPVHPLERPWPQRHRVTLERLPTGWFVQVDGRDLGGVSLRNEGELPEIRLSATGGPAWFSDMLIEELVPADPQPDIAKVAAFTGSPVPGSHRASASVSPCVRPGRSGGGSRSPAEAGSDVRRTTRHRGRAVSTAGSGGSAGFRNRQRVRASP